MRKIDFVGITLFAGSIGSLLMGVIWAAGMYSSRDVHVIAPIVIGSVGILAFGVWCHHKGDDALIPPRLFRGKVRIFVLPVTVSLVCISLRKIVGC